MKARTQHSGNVEIPPRAVVAIWADEACGETFSHTVEVGCGKGTHCLYRVTEEGARKLSCLSDVKIRQLELGPRGDWLGDLLVCSLAEIQEGCVAVPYRTNSSPRTPGQQTLGAWVASRGGDGR